jgi:hypothetical protein
MPSIIRFPAKPGSLYSNNSHKRAKPGVEPVKLRHGGVFDQ